jgi:hypothetical protein
MEKQRQEERLAAEREIAKTEHAGLSAELKVIEQKRAAATVWRAEQKEKKRQLALDRIRKQQALEHELKLKAEAEKNITDFGDGIKVLNGRFGPYATDGKKNAKVPKDTDPKSITHTQAKELLANAPAKRGRVRNTGKKTTTKKTATKKSTSKKS